MASRGAPQVGASPGGPSLSSAKKRRLAALEQKGAAAGSSASAPKARRQQPGGTASAAATAAAAGPGGPLRQGSAGSPGGGAARPARPPQQGPLQQQPQQHEPIYARLEESLGAGPVGRALGLPPPAPGAPVVEQLLGEALATHPARARDAQASIGLRLQDRTVMLDNPAGRSGGGAGRPRPLSSQLASRKRQRQLGLYDLRNAGLTYNAVLPLHQRWQQYMRGLLQGAHQQQQGAGTPAQQQQQQQLEGRLLAADLHGALLRVSESREARYAGLSGICVRSTRHTFQLVTPADRLVIVPKAGCTWEYDADQQRVVTLLGAGLVPKAAQDKRRGRGRR